MSNFTKMRILAFLFLITNSGSDLFAGWADYFDFSKLNTEAVGEKTKELASKIDGKQATMAIALAAAMAYGYKVYRNSQWMNKIQEKIDEPDVSARPGSAPGREGVWAKWRKQPKVWTPSQAYESPNNITIKSNDQLVQEVLNDLRNGRLVFEGIDPSFRDDLALFNILIEFVEAEKQELYDYIIELGMQIEVGAEESDSNYYTKYLGSFFGRDKVMLQQKFEDKLYSIFNTRVNRSINGLNGLGVLTPEDIALRQQFIDKVCGTSLTAGTLISKRAAGLFFDTAVAYGRLVAIENKLLGYRAELSSRRLQPQRGAQISLARR